MSRPYETSCAPVLWQELRAGRSRSFPRRGVPIRAERSTRCAKGRIWTCPPRCTLHCEERIGFVDGRPLNASTVVDADHSSRNRPALGTVITQRSGQTRRRRDSPFGPLRLNGSRMAASCGRVSRTVARRSCAPTYVACRTLTRRVDLPAMSDATPCGRLRARSRCR